MEQERRTKRVAIACQGGGSHSAFTAGVLTRLLAEKLERYEIVALSGTSGGAICALLVWYALLRNDRGEAVRLLDSFWESVSASSPKERVMNDLSVEASRMQGSVATPLITPYLYPEWGKEALKELLEGVVDFGEIRRLVTGLSPKLLVGAALPGPRPERVSGLLRVSVSSADSPRTQLDGLLLRSGRNTVESLVEAVGVDAEVLFQESEEVVVNAVVAGGAGCGILMLHWNLQFLCRGPGELQLSRGHFFIRHLYSTINLSLMQEI